MKRTEIRAGVVYAVRQYRESSPDPVAFLEDAPALWQRWDGRWTPADDPHRVLRPREGTRFKAAYGYPAVAAGNPEALTGLDPAAELERLRLGVTEPRQPGTRWTLITRLATVTGPWE